VRRSKSPPPPEPQFKWLVFWTPRGEALAWALFDPQSPIRLRILSTDPKPPGAQSFQKGLARAWNLRKMFIDKKTNCFRLCNGEGDGLPGLVCDFYNGQVVIQFDGPGPEKFWDRNVIGEGLLKLSPCHSVFEKSRDRSDFVHLKGPPLTGPVLVQEKGVRFKVDIAKGQKTGFFLDQRENRDYVRSLASGKEVLNLFSYTGGFSIYAGLGQAREVTSVDRSAEALEGAEENWLLNGLPPDRHRRVESDVFEFLKNEKHLWEFLVVDPPSMAHSEKQKPQATKKYIELYSAAARRLRPGGSLFLSSCSSHIGFQDFFQIINEALSQARKNGRFFRVSGQGPDHPFPHACHELRYLKFAHLVLD